MVFAFEREVTRLRIHRAADVPAYTQIASALRDLMAKTPVATGTLLPPERELCKQFGVSRMTLRQAFTVLEREGLLHSERGRGTFVSQGHIYKQQQEFRSFTEEMRSRGAKPSSRLLSFGQCAPDAGEQAFFAIAADEPVYAIERLRLADGVPMVLESAKLPVKLCPELTRFDLTRDSLYRILEQEFGVRLVRSVEEMGATMGTRRVRTALEAPRSTPLLEIHRKSFAAGDRPVELACAQFRGDLYRAVVRSSRPAAI